MSACQYQQFVSTSGYDLNLYEILDTVARVIFQMYHGVIIMKYCFASQNVYCYDFANI